MIGDIDLGYDGSGEELATHYVRRGDRLIAECWGREREADPVAEVTELERRAETNRQMAGLAGAGSDYPARERDRQRAAVAIRTAFPAAFAASHVHTRDTITTTPDQAPAV